jgi:hypothetical protein
MLTEKVSKNRKCGNIILIVNIRQRLTTLVDMGEGYFYPAPPLFYSEAQYVYVVSYTTIELHFTPMLKVEQGPTLVPSATTVVQVALVALPEGIRVTSLL